MQMRLVKMTESGTPDLFLKSTKYAFLRFGLPNALARGKVRLNPDEVKIPSHALNLYEQRMMSGCW